MSKEKKQRILDLLNSYQDRKQKIGVLRYELENLVRISVDEMIDVMTYGWHDNGLGSPKGDFSNKTLYTAMSYKEMAERINTETAHEIAAKLLEEEQCQNKLDHHIGLLEKRQADVIRLVFLEKITVKDVAKQYGMTDRTITRIKNIAIEKLAELYTYSEDIKG